jgi:large subunit ribosomal protein L6
MPVYAEVRKTVEVEDGVKVNYDTTSGEFTVVGPLGTLKRTFINPKITVECKGKTVTLFSNLPKRKDYALIGTWAAHITNMVDGVTKGFEYKMKIVYSHFPIKTHVKDDELIIENFLGEKLPRKARMVGDTKVKVSGDQIVVNGIDIEAAGQSVANIERATKIKRYDPRVFQDGIYLVEHPKKNI